MTPRIAVLLPCYNEGTAIAQTVAGFRAALPGAAIYVYDNNSADDTVAVARAAGAIVRTERMQGKGNVVRRMFADVDADIYVMADGDATYDASAAPALVQRLLDEQLDMVVGSRVTQVTAAYRRGHVLGNKAMTGLLAQLFGRSFTDIFSGYRVFSRRFVKSFPVLSSGFEIETEISVHALELKMPVGEIETPYFARPEGSESKLSTYRDGFRIARTIVTLYRIERPLLFFGIIAGALLLAAFALAVPLIVTYMDTHLVPRLPTAVLVTGLTILAALNVFTGLILDTVVRGRREVRRLAYLGHRAPGGEERRSGNMSTGARVVLATNLLESFDLAEVEYDRFRNRADDIAAIVRNIGWRRNRIQRIKQHVFSALHDLGDGRRRSDADPAIVNAWSRLERGDFIEQDLALLRHELFEARFEAIYRSNHRTAHDAANRSGRSWVPGD